MEREGLFLLLASALTWLAIIGATVVATRSSGSCRGEPAAWWHVVLPTYVGGIVLSFLTGWALQEPDPSDERAAALFYVLAAAALGVLVRATWRAIAGVRAVRRAHICVGTIGLLRPRVHVSRAFQRAASPELLAAAIAHEEAHARAFDPLRMVVARFCADLQWPLPGARRRLESWLGALEIRRDEEAVANGACPISLAEAIVLAARLCPAGRDTQIAAVVGTPGSLAVRVRRLLSDGPVPQPRARKAAWVPALCASLVIAAGWLGIACGDSLLGLVPGVLR